VTPDARDDSVQSRAIPVSRSVAIVALADGARIQQQIDEGLRLR